MSSLGSAKLILMMLRILTLATIIYINSRKKVLLLSKIHSYSSWLVINLKYRHTALAASRSTFACTLILICSFWWPLSQIATLASACSYVRRCRRAETARKLQPYDTTIFQVHSFVRQRDYYNVSRIVVVVYHCQKRIWEDQMYVQFNTSSFKI